MPVKQIRTAFSMISELFESIELPADWQYPKLGEVITLQRGKDLPVQNRQAGTIPVIGSSGFVGFHNACVKEALLPGLTVGRSGSVGTLTYMEEPYWPLNTALYVKDFHGHLPKFLYYWLQKFDFKKYAQGVSVPTLNRNIIHEIRIPLPTLPEQSAIANLLTTVQQAKEARQQELAVEQERKAAIMDHLFTHGTLNESRKQTEIGEIPQSWKIVPLKQCAYVQTGTAKGRKLEGVETIEVPYLRVANVQDGHLDLSEIKTISIKKTELERFLLSPGDILMTEGGDFDKLGRGFIWNGEIEHCVHQNHVFAVRADQAMLSPGFLCYLIQSPHAKRYFLSVAHKTTNLACINKSKLERFPVPIPCLDEQEKIGRVLAGCDSKIQATKKEISLIDELFQVLLEKLMTGQLSTLPLLKTTREVVAI